MNEVHYSLIAPLVRGLYLGAGAEAVVLAPCSRGQADGSGLSVKLPPLGQAEATAAWEVQAAAALEEALASWKVGREALDLPAFVSVSIDDQAHSFCPGWDYDEARRRAAENPPALFRAGAKGPSLGMTALDRSRVVAGRVALVTGGAQGFGEEIVRGLASSGALVFIADMNYEGAQRLAAELNAGAKRTVALPLAVNVADEASVAAMFASVAEAAGGIDLVVSNAGVLKAFSVLEQDLASFKFVTDVNYVGFMLMTKHAALILRRQRRAAPAWSTDIVQINSKSGLEGSNKNGSYAGSKFGGIGLVQSFALELVEFGVKVNAICPGNFLDGPLWSDPDRGLFVQYLRSGKVPGAKTVADVRAAYEAKVPMRRGCSGADVMRALYYLVEQEYETGQALPVTGGQVMLS